MGVGNVEWKEENIKQNLLCFRIKNLGENYFHLVEISFRFFRWKVSGQTTECVPLYLSQMFSIKWSHFTFGKHRLVKFGAQLFIDTIIIWYFFSSSSSIFPLFYNKKTHKNFLLCLYAHKTFLSLLRLSVEKRKKKQMETVKTTKMVEGWWRKTDINTHTQIDLKRENEKKPISLRT